jgi:serine/threonine-protein kinase HipA
VAKVRRDIGVYVGSHPAPAGLLRFEQQGRREFAAFEYDQEWVRTGHSIDPGLLWTSGPQFVPCVSTQSPFGGAIADNEPDGWGRRVILRQHRKVRTSEADALSRSPLNALDYLLQVDDAARIGSLRFRDETGTFQRARNEWSGLPPLVQLSRLMRASHAFERSTESVDELTYLLGRGTSLGGIRPKCVVEDEHGTLFVGKFPSVNDERPVTAAEVLALRLAEKAGIETAHAALHRVDGADIAVIRRFDRTQDGARIPYVSARTMLGATDNDREPHDYLEIAEAIRRWGADPLQQLEELWRRIVFNVLITNIDDHLANHGFLHVAADRWRLSPAFDLNPFPDRVREFKTWLSPELGPEARVDSALALAAAMGVTRSRTIEILAQVDSAVDTWRSTGAALGLSGHDLDVLADAFEHEERAVARRALGLG